MRHTGSVSTATYTSWLSVHDDVIPINQKDTVMDPFLGQIILFNTPAARETYLKYELTNVQVTSFDVNASGN